MCRPWTVGVAYVTVGTGRSAATRRPTTARTALAHLRRGDRGAAAVEFALLVPILLIVVFGIVDFGLLMNSSSLVSNAAREGARVGSLEGTQKASEDAAKAAMTGLIGTIPGPGTGLVAACSTGGATPATCTGWTGTSGTTAAPAGGTVTVTITYNYTWLTPIVRLLGFKSTLTVVRSSQMKVE